MKDDEKIMVSMSMMDFVNAVALGYAVAKEQEELSASVLAKAYKYQQMISQDAYAAMPIVRENAARTVQILQTMNETNRSLN